MELAIFALGRMRLHLCILQEKSKFPPIGGGGDFVACGFFHLL